MNGVYIFCIKKEGHERRASEINSMRVVEYIEIKCYISFSTVSRFSGFQLNDTTVMMTMMMETTMTTVAVHGHDRQRKKSAIDAACFSSSKTM